MSYGRGKLMKIKRLSEAHYGGAFDIKDDQYFTKEDVESASEEVLNHIKETFNDEYFLGGYWFEHSEFIVNIVDVNHNEYEASVKVDMRKIKTPRDLKKYSLDIASKIIAQIKDDNKMHESYTVYSISNREHEKEVDRLIAEYEADGWKPWDSKYSGSKYYVILARRGEKGGEFKAIQYSNQLFPRVIDINYKQAQGYEPIDDFDGLRRELGRILLPKREGLNESTDFIWDSMGNGRYRVCHKPTNLEADVYTDFRQKGRYILDRVDGKIIKGAQKMTRAEVQNRIKHFADTLTENKEDALYDYKTRNATGSWERDDLDPLSKETKECYAVYALDVSTGKEYCAGAYDTEKDAHYWASMDRAADIEYGYGDFKYRVEKVSDYTDEMFASYKEFSALKLSNHSKANNENKPLDEATYPRHFKLGEKQIQYVKVYNQYGYTIQEIRIDNDAKTFERGNFSIGHDKAYKNRQAYEDFIEELVEMGYKEIPSDYRCLRNKTRKGVPMTENTFADKVARFKKAFDFGVEGYKAGLKVGGAYNEEFLTWMNSLGLPLGSREQLRLLDEYNKGWMKANLDNWDYDKGEEKYSVGSGKKIAVEPIDEDVRLAPTDLKGARKTYDVDALEKDILEVENVVDVDFDLDMYEELSQVILLTKYSIPSNDNNWHAKIKQIKKDVIKVAKNHGLVWSGDTIEDYGEWLYFVFDEPLTKNEAFEPTYDKNDGWTDADIELHKSTDWKARNYAEVPVPEDSFMHTAVAYTDDGVKRKSCKFIKVIRPNSIFPPYYRPEVDPFDDVVGPMYDGEDYNGYGIHNRYESQKVYDRLFDNWKRNGKKLSEGLEDKRVSHEFLERACVIALQALINDDVPFPTGRYLVDSWQEWISEIRMGCPGGFILEDAECIRDFLEANGKFEDELEYLNMMIGKFVKYHPIDEAFIVTDNKTLKESKQGFVKNHGDCRILYVGSTYVVTDNKGLNIGESPTMSGAEAIADEHSKKNVNEGIDEGHEVYGSWSVDFTITLEGDEVRFDDLSEVSQEHIAKLIGEGYVSGEVCEHDSETDETKYGWWSINRELYLDDEEDITWDGLDDASQEHIADAIKDGYTSGELCVWREGEESLPSEFNMDTEIIDYVDLDDEDEVNDAIIEFALETFDREPDTFDFAINGSVIEVTNIVWGATNDSLSEAKSNRKISLYINGEYICSSTQYSSCKEFVDKVKDDGKIEYQGLKGKGTGKVTRELKDGDKVTARISNSMKENKSLTEAPIINLSGDELNNPSEINFKKKIAKATAEEEAEKARKEKEARKAEVRKQYQGLLDKVSSMPNDEGDDFNRLEALFEELVPGEGKAETVAGELLRATMRLIYRYYNDGDYFFMGYGLETAAPSASYLVERYDDIIYNAQEIGERFANSFDTKSLDREYEAFLREVSDKVVDDIIANPELIAEMNDTDSRNFDCRWLEDEQPKFEYDFMVGYDVGEMVDADIVSRRDVEDYVEDCLSWDSAMSGCEISYDGGDYVYISELTYDGLNELKGRIREDVDSFWEDFIADHEDELEAYRNQDDEESDDDSDEDDE